MPACILFLEFSPAFLEPSETQNLKVTSTLASPRVFPSPQQCGNYQNSHEDVLGAFSLASCTPALHSFRAEQMSREYPAKWKLVFCLVLFGSCISRLLSLSFFPQGMLKYLLVFSLLIATVLRLLPGISPLLLPALGKCPKEE